jgi:hypothetical protein
MGIGSFNRACSVSSCLIRCANHWIQVNCERSSFKLVGMAKDNFPVLTGGSGTVPAKRLFLGGAAAASDLAEVVGVPVEHRSLIVYAMHRQGTSRNPREPGNRVVELNRNRVAGPLGQKSCGLSNDFDAPDHRILLLAVGQKNRFPSRILNFSDKPTYVQVTAGFERPRTLKATLRAHSEAVIRA